MRAGILRERLVRAMATAMRTRGADAIALTADRTKAMAVALVGIDDATDVRMGALDLSTRDVATVLGFHPEHVRRLIRTGRMPAQRVGTDYRVRVDDLWPLLEARHREPGQRRLGLRR